jgi:hypothetical protein
LPLIREKFKFLFKIFQGDVTNPEVKATNATIQEIEGWSPNGGGWFELHFVFGLLKINKVDECLAGCTENTDVKVKECLDAEEPNCHKNKEWCLGVCITRERVLGKEFAKEPCNKNCEKSYKICEKNCKKEVEEVAETCRKNCTETPQYSIVPEMQFYLNDRPIFAHWLYQYAEIHHITV